MERHMQRPRKPKLRWKKFVEYTIWDLKFLNFFIGFFIGFPFNNCNLTLIRPSRSCWRMGNQGNGGLTITYSFGREGSWWRGALPGDALCVKRSCPPYPTTTIFYHFHSNSPGEYSRLINCQPSNIWYKLFALEDYGIPVSLIWILTFHVTGIL